MANVFLVPRATYHGDNSLDVLKTIGGKKAMIVTGKGSMIKYGFVDKVTKLLNEGGIEVEVFDGVEPDPSIETCKAGGEAMRNFEPDWIVALGGGSAMDAAKIMWVYYEHPDYDFMELVNFNFPPLRNKAKLICIPSTSGTGSEITAFSVITDYEAQVKYPLVSPDIVPDIAILDVDLPAKMPPKVTAATGMDVLTHAIEAYVSTSADDYTDCMALAAIKLVFEYLERAYKNGDDLEARAKMHDASCMAAMAFNNASLGIVHSLAHKIGGVFHITHGEANAIMLPYVIDYNRKATQKYAKLEGELGIDNIAQAVRELNTRVGITNNFKDGKNTVIERKAFDEAKNLMSERAFKDACTLTNPRETSPEDLLKIYEKAYEGECIDF
ncbi:MAG: iron-containing alcohol dehydrogenase [Tissierellia bacterium]|nr:iron-containing alcohol dehydrogenase [Tissierellia bacterium]